MKQFYFLLFALSLFTTANAQVINFPDPAFENLLVSSRSFNTIAKDLNGNYFAIDANQNSLIEQDEALNVSYIFINSLYGCSDLSGIEYFVNLQTLEAGYNTYLTSINVSGLTNLQTLNCQHNPYLSSLNVSGATSLVNLNCSSSILTSLDVNGLTNLKTLDCSSGQISTLNVSGTSNLQTLNCGGNHFSSLNLSGLVSLITLNCRYNQISSINLNGLNNLKTLNCESNLFTSLDVSGLANLQVLSCNDNHLTALNTSGLLNLNRLYCYRNNFAALDVSTLINLDLLDCSENQISNMDMSNLANIEYLNCSHNQLATLNLGSIANIKSLDYSYNHLSSLNLSNFANLHELNCSENQITSLSLNPSANLSFLWCSDNQLTSIDLSNFSNLQELGCHFNQLTAINLNNLTNLQRFYCNHNQITSIDFSNSPMLTNIDCGENFITEVNVNDLTQLDWLECYGNPNLQSIFNKNGRIESIFNFSDSPNLNFICVDEEQVSETLSLVNTFGYVNCTVNSYCSFVPGGTFYTLQGNNRFDSNNDGFDVTDISLLNMNFTITDGTNTGNIISNVSGAYSIPVQVGMHTVTPVLENPAYFTVSPTNIVVDFPTQTSPFTQNFCVTTNGIHSDLEVVMVPLTPARPGFDTEYTLVYKNKGNQIQSGSVNLNFDDSVLDFVTASPTTSNQSTGNMSWDFVNLQPFETREITLTLNLNSPTETPGVNGGDVLNYAAAITSAVTDETPNDNTFALNQTVVNSFDPNDKTCLEGTTIAPSEVGKYVHYLIRFENTGTANAQNIVVKDMIDTAKFDINSLVPIKGSHSFVTNITAGNKVEFIFENINLPFDDVNNDGYVAFKIKTKPTLVAGNTFSNTASIYFDYNFPIVTNTAVTTIQALSIQDFAFGTYFTMYPNPVNNVLNIETKQTIEVSSVSIYNQLGQLVLVIPNAQNTKSVDVSSLSSGNYFIKINSDKGTSNAKFIKK